MPICHILQKVFLYLLFYFLGHAYVFILCFFHKYIWARMHIHRRNLRYFLYICIFIIVNTYAKKERKIRDVLMLWCSFQPIPELVEDHRLFTRGWLVTDDASEKCISSQISSKKQNKSYLRDGLGSFQTITSVIFASFL